jgi:hypothetical protein
MNVPKNVLFPLPLDSMAPADLKAALQVIGQQQNVPA